MPDANAPASWRDGDDFIGAKLILTCGDRLLVMLRDDFAHIPYPAHWDLPGGGREQKESAVNCALREFREEFGLCIAASRLSAPSAFPNPGSGRIAIYFAGTLLPSEIVAIRFGNEGQCWQMMPITEFLSHPRAVPHFPGRVRACLGLTATG